MEKSIYMKTEPGGRIGFCELNESQIKLLENSFKEKDLNEDLEELKYDGMDTEAEGVFNFGSEGSLGNEGKIIFSEEIDFIGPKLLANGKFKDVIYGVIMRLSKCSIEFEFSLNDDYKKEKFEEISVPVILPKQIKHELYGHQASNIIIGFNYEGEYIEEYEGEIEDRGFDDQFIFFAIKEGKAEIIYSNNDGNEYWIDDYNFMN